MTDLSLFFSYILKQINRWIDPLAEHLIINIKDTSLPTDHSSWIIKTLSSDTETFKDPHAAARAVCILIHSSSYFPNSLFQYAHFFIKNLDSLYAFEEDLIDFDLPERPTSATQYKEAYLDENHEGATNEINNMIKIMKAKKTTSETTGYWSLDAFSHSTWRVAQQKNQGRDFRKFATAAYYEEMFVSEYRQDLFDNSDVARFLHTSLRVCLSVFVKPRNTIHKGSVVVNRFYNFPDRSKVSLCKERPELNIEELIASNDRVAYITNARKSIQGLKKSIASHYCAKRIPGSKNVNPEVAAAIDNLENVGCLCFPFLSFHLTISQVLIKNANILQRMSASGLDLDQINPSDFMVKDDEIMGMPHKLGPPSDPDAEGSDEEENDALSPDTNIKITNDNANSISDHSIPDEGILNPTAIFIPDSSNPSSNYPSHPPSPSPSSSAQLDLPDNTIPPSSSLNVPLPDVASKGKKRSSRDTSWSPGFYSHLFLLLIFNICL